MKLIIAGSEKLSPCDEAITEILTKLPIEHHIKEITEVISAPHIGLLQEAESWGAHMGITISRFMPSYDCDKLNLLKVCNEEIASYGDILLLINAGDTPYHPLKARMLRCGKPVYEAVYTCTVTRHPPISEAESAQ